MSQVALWHVYMFKVFVIINHSILKDKRDKLSIIFILVQTLCNVSIEIVNFSTIVPLAQIHVAVFCIITVFLSGHFRICVCLQCVRHHRDLGAGHKTYKLGLLFSGR